MSEKNIYNDNIKEVFSYRPKFTKYTKKNSGFGFIFFPAGTILGSPVMESIANKLALQNGTYYANAYQFQNFINGLTPLFSFDVHSVLFNDGSETPLLNRDRDNISNSIWVNYKLTIPQMQQYHSSSLFTCLC